MWLPLPGQGQELQPMGQPVCQAPGARRAGCVRGGPVPARTCAHALRCCSTGHPSSPKWLTFRPAHRLWCLSPPPMRELAVLTGSGSAVTCVAAGAAGGCCVAGAQDGSVRWVRAAMGQSSQEAVHACHDPDPTHGGQRSTCACALPPRHPCPRRSVWDLASKQLKATLTGHRGPVHGCALLPGGAECVTAGHDRTLK